MEKEKEKTKEKERKKEVVREEGIRDPETNTEPKSKRFELDFSQSKCE